MRIVLVLGLLAPLALGCSGCPKSNESDGGTDADGSVETRPEPICLDGTFGFSGDVFVDVSERMGFRVDEQGPENTNARCNDEFDNDGDGQVDCDDTDCNRNQGVTICAGTGAENDNTLCADGLDNDDDGYTDCDDYDCSQYASVSICGAEDTEPLCTDGIDNDSDGFVDCEDYSCSRKSNLAELCGLEDTDALCTDGIDNDSDGYVDCDDANCRALSLPSCCGSFKPEPKDFRAYRLMSTDLDGDGYSDLVVQRAGGNSRGLQRVYMNRLDDTDPEKRVFEEVFDTDIGANRRSGYGCRSAAFHIAGDVDNDGDEDLFSGVYVSQLEDPLDRQEILLNDGDGTFSLVAGGSSVATIDPPANSAAVFLDYDRDGNLDLYVGNWYEHYGLSLNSLQDELYKGNGDGTFTLVTDQAGLTQQAGTGTHDNRKPTYGLSHCDVDGDGDQDILAPAYGRQWNDLFLNNGDGTFTNIGESSHFDGDALTDFSDAQFYICHCQTDPTGCPAELPPVWVDCRARGWSSDDEAPFRQNGNTFGTFCGDYDNDGDQDVLTAEIAHDWAGSSSDLSQVLRNDGGQGTALTFTRLAPEESGVIYDRDSSRNWNEGGLHGAWFDYDNDGLLDALLIAGPYPGDRVHLFKQKDDHTFSERARATGLSLGYAGSMTLADYDRDGDVDVFAGVIRSSTSGWAKEYLFLFENQLGQLNNHTRILLQGAGPPDGANRDAIGARVTVTSGNLTQMREVLSSGGQFGQQLERALTFGFGLRCDDLTIEVRWPNRDKTVQTFEGVRANYPIRIVEGQDQVEYLTAE